MGNWKEYAAVKPKMFSQRDAAALCKENGLKGTEVYFDDLVPRDLPLCLNGAAEGVLTRQLEQELEQVNGPFALLHELKNSKDIFADLVTQRKTLGGTEQ